MTQTPHDALFRAVFSQRQHAVGALRSMLPVSISVRIDWSTLELDTGSFVSDELEARVTDLVFRVDLLDGRSARLCLLFEHQSSVDAWMPLRLLEYMVAIWNTHRRQQPGRRLPLVIPIVLHHSQRGWTAPADLDHLLDSDAVTLDELAPHLPRFEFVLLDLGATESRELHESAMTALGRLALWCLKRARDGERFLAELGDFADIYHGAVADGGSRAVAPVMRYIHIVTRLEAAVVARAMRENVSIEAEDAYVTSGQRLLAEGRAQGREEGREEGRAEGQADGQCTLLLEQLELKFGDLPAGARARVRVGSPTELRLWAARVLSETLLESVLE